MAVHRRRGVTGVLRSLGPQQNGVQIVRVRTEARCLCCKPGVRDQLERWIAIWKSGNPFESDGSRVSKVWILTQAPIRLGEPISESSLQNHCRKHIQWEHVPDGSLTPKQVVEEEVKGNLEQTRHDVRNDPEAHRTLLEEVVAVGLERVRAEPSVVSVDHALAAAKELNRIRQEGDRNELIKAIGGVRRVPEVAAPSPLIVDLPVEVVRVAAD